MFIYCMDRLVWFILVIVICNAALDITEVTAQTKDNNKYIQKIKHTKDNEAIPLSSSSSSQQIQRYQSDNIEIIQPEDEQENNFYENEQQHHKQQSSTEKSQNLFWPSSDTESRNPILDSIFNIPITTLQAVSELVQNIVGVGRSFITGRLQSRQHHIGNGNGGSGSDVIHSTTTQIRNQDLQVQNFDNNHERI